MQLNSRNIRLGGLFFCIEVLAFAVPLLSLPRIPAIDWDYFNSLSLVARSNVLSYRRFPLHDPWICGGLDILANPQTRVFSPFGLLDLVLPPYAANLLTMFLLAYCGLWASYLYFCHRGKSCKVAFVLSLVFNNGSWFALHAAGGVVSFGFFHLFPLMLLALERFRSERYQVLFVLLLVLLLLDSGVYAFFFSLLFFLAAIVVSWIPLGALMQALRRRRDKGLFLVLLFLLLSAAKVVPVLLLIGDRLPELDVDALTPQELLDMAFNPLQTVYRSLDAAHWRSLSSSGCYLGFLATSLVLFASLRIQYLRANWRALVLGLFFLWMGTAWGYPWNPWALYEKLPLFQQAHMQSRVLVLAVFCFVVLLADALTLFEQQRYFPVLALFLVLEGLFLRNYSFYNVLESTAKENDSVQLIATEQISRTIPWAWRPEHYYQGLGSRDCYEKSRPQTTVVDHTQASYRGEVYFRDDPLGKVQILSFTPGRIQLRYEATTGRELEINTNALLGWRVKSGNAKVGQEVGSLLRVRVYQSKGELELIYWPRYLSPVFLAFVLGAMLAVALLSSTRNVAAGA